MIVTEVEYLSCCVRKKGKERWLTGKLIRVWRDGSASVQPPDMENGWIIARKGEWREKR